MAENPYQSPETDAGPSAEIDLAARRRTANYIGIALAFGVGMILNATIGTLPALLAVTGYFVVKIVLSALMRARDSRKVAARTDSNSPQITMPKE